MRGPRRPIRERLIHTIFSEGERLVACWRYGVSDVRASHSRLSSLSRDEIAATASANGRRRENRTVGIFKVDNGWDARTWRVRRTLYALRAKRMFITDTTYGVSFARVLDGWAATTTTVDNGNSPIHARRSI